MSRASPLIILIEPNEDNREVYGTILRHFGFEVVEASTGREGVDQVRALLPDLVMLRRGLPDLDPWEAARMLRSDPSTSAIPIVGMSAMAMEEERNQALSAGCTSFLDTPVEPHTVVAEVRRLLT